MASIGSQQNQNYCTQIFGNGFCTIFSKNILLLGNHTVLFAGNPSYNICVTEKSYYAQITKYYVKHAKITTVWEAKFTRTSYLNFKCLPDHQEEFLLQSERAYGHKIEDSGVRKKPFDGFVIVKGLVVFIAIFYLPRATEIYEIGIRDFLKEKYQSGKKSLTKERAREIGKLINPSL